MANGRIHRIARATFYAVAWAANGANRSVKCATSVQTLVGVTRLLYTFVALQVLTSIPTRKHANGWAWTRSVPLSVSPPSCISAFFLLQLNCEELVEGYENPVAGVTHSTAGKGDDDGDDDGGDDDDAAPAPAPADGSPPKKKKPKPSGSSSSSSSKSISILTRTASEFDTCTQEKAVEFDPVQGNTPPPSLPCEMTCFIFYSIL